MIYFGFFEYIITGPFAELLIVDSLIYSTKIYVRYQKGKQVNYGGGL